MVLVSGTPRVKSGSRHVAPKPPANHFENLPQRPNTSCALSPSINYGLVSTRQSMLHRGGRGLDNGIGLVAWHPTNIVSRFATMDSFLTLC